MVNFNSIIGKLFAASTILAVAQAHPGEAHDHEEHAHALAKRSEHASNIARGLESCASHPNYLALQKRASARRAAKANALRKTRNIPLDSMLNPLGDERIIF